MFIYLASYQASDHSSIGSFGKSNAFLALLSIFDRLICYFNESLSKIQQKYSFLYTFPSVGNSHSIGKHRRIDWQNSSKRLKNGCLTHALQCFRLDYTSDPGIPQFIFQWESTYFQFIYFNYYSNQWYKCLLYTLP